MYAERQEINEEVIKRTIMKRNKYLCKFNERKKSQNDLNVSDVVLKRVVQPEKLDKKWKRPYLIIDKYNYGIYSIKSIENGNVYRSHRDDLILPGDQDPENDIQPDLETNEGELLPKGKILIRNSNGFLENNFTPTINQ
ncbi:hypothetical protein A0H76_2545 [Hepatospora eriocheir]|uniref:Uncharacterized protein n=1 Tax=Hepatospora eriocheir TaxID=1081669 RepID=A0A1X0QJM8_9MICR|nr:hypothetical protein A0H76_2545 [Hepatospora eriocheir]